MNLIDELMKKEELESSPNNITIANAGIFRNMPYDVADILTINNNLNVIGKSTPGVIYTEMSATYMPIGVQINDESIERIAERVCELLTERSIR